MGKRSLPPLKPSEVVAILTNLGFVLKRQEGSHAQYEHIANTTHARSLVTVDMQYREFDDQMMQNMIRQSNRTRQEFYGATKRSARKASVPFLRASGSPEIEM